MTTVVYHTNIFYDFQVVNSGCNIFTTSVHKKARLSKEEIERLSKLHPMDRSVIGADGQTLFYPVIRRYVLCY